MKTFHVACHTAYHTDSAHIYIHGYVAKLYNISPSVHMHSYPTHASLLIATHANTH